MTRDEFQQLLEAIALRDLKLRHIAAYEEGRYLKHRMAELASAARLAYVIADRPNRAELYVVLGDELVGEAQTPIYFLRDLFEEAGVMDALDSHLELLRPHLTIDLVPEEDIEFLRSCGMREPEAEITIALAHLRERSYVHDRKGRNAPFTASAILDEADHLLQKLGHDLQTDRAHNVDAKQAPAAAVGEIVKRPKKMFNGIGKILSGVVAGTGNVLIGAGAIPASGGAAVAGVIASAAVSIGLIMQGIGDLRGE